MHRISHGGPQTIGKLVCKWVANIPKKPGRITPYNAQSTIIYQLLHSYHFK